MQWNVAGNAHIDMKNLLLKHRRKERSIFVVVNDLCDAAEGHRLFTWSGCVEPQKLPKKFSHRNIRLTIPFSPCVFRIQCCWAWSSPRASGGGSSGWRSQCRTTLWPQESPWGKVQPHPGLNPCQPYLHPSLNSSFFFCSNKEPQPICLYRRNPIWCLTDISLLHIPSAFFWYLLFKKRFVLFLLFVYFDRSTLCISKYMIQSLPLPL